MRINHNLAAMNANRMMSQNSVNAGKGMEKLSTGLRINRGADDAAGLAVSEKMRSQIRGLDQAQRNSQDAISLIQTAEGGLNETHDMLHRIRELAVQASNDTLQDADRTLLNDEVTQLIGAIDKIGTDTQFNKQNILATDQTLDIQVGANNGQTLQMTWKAQIKTALGEDATDISGVTIATKAGAQAAITTMDTAIESVSKSRSKMGAFQNRLEHSINNLGTSSENLTAAESRIRDTDMAKEMMKMSKDNILSQAAQAMLAQANQQPQGVLQLLR